MIDNEKDKIKNSDSFDGKNPAGDTDEILSVIEEYKKKYSVNADTLKDKEEEKALPEKSDDDAILSHFSGHAKQIPAEGTVTPAGIAAHFSAADNSADGESEKNDTDSAGVESNADAKAPAPEKEKKSRRIGKKVLHFFGGFSFAAKAAVYIVLVSVIAAYLSYTVITVGNDAFAFVKGDREVSVEIPKDANCDDVTKILEEKGVINCPRVFNFFAKHQTDKEFPFIAGLHKLNTNMNYSQLWSKLTVIPYVRKEVRITVPEGFTVDQIIDLLVSKGVGSKDEYVKAINSYPYKHEFVNELEKLGYPETRKYRLEGYLYPDTYDFYQDEDEYKVINKFLNNFERRVWRHYKTVFKADIDKLGMSFDDIITLASMIQAEARFAADFECISYVFHNRLNHPQTYPKLESDATIQYFLEARREDLTKEDLETDNPYNTYKYKGLPPGSICNPGIDAITTAIYPSAPTDEKGKPVGAYFFVSNKAGRTYYAVTPAQHEANKRKVAADNIKLEQERKPQ